MDKSRIGLWLKRIAITTAGLLAFCYVLYLALGYWYLPGKLKQVAEEQGSDYLGRQISVESFAYNPFTLELQSENFSIADRPDKPLAHWDHLSINVDFWPSLFSWHLVVKEVQLAGPQINILQTADGFNFDSIINSINQKTADAEPEVENTEQSEPIGVEVKLIQITAGAFHYEDTTGRVPADTGIEDFNLVFNDLYVDTGANNSNPFDIAADLADGGSINLNGDYRLQPLLFNINMQAQAINLAGFADFVRNVINADLKNGTLDAQATVHIVKPSADTATQITLNQSRVAVTDLAVDDETLDPPLLRLDTFAIDAIQLDVLERSLDVGTVIVDGLSINQWLDENGAMRYQSLLLHAHEQTMASAGNSAGASSEPDTASAPQSATEAPQDEQAPWRLRLGEFKISRSQTHFTDQQVNPPVRWSLEQLDASLAPIVLNSNESAELDLSAQLNQAPLTMGGQLTLDPIGITLDIALEQLATAPVTPYLNQATNIAIDDGALTTQAQFTLNTQPELDVIATANTQLANAVFINTVSQDKFLSWENLDISNTRFQYPQMELDIESIALSSPWASMTRATPSTWETLVKEPASSNDADADADADAEQGNALALSIARMEINGGNIYFKDQLIQPEFSSAINDIEMSLTDFSTRDAQNLSATLKASINKHAPLSIKAETTANKKEIEGSVSSLNLKGLTPYTGTYIGYQVDQGDLNYHFDYTLEGTKITGANDIVAQKFELGDSVESEQAIEAPIKLGLTLLKDLQGNINLDLGISGDQSDPGFNIPGLITKTFINILVKAAASPFTLLGSLVSSDENLGEVHFEPGSTTLSKEQRKTLSHLADALAKKPELVLVVQGNADRQADTLQLQRRELLSQLQKDDAQPLSLPISDEALLAALIDNPARRHLEKQYEESSGQTLKQLQNTLSDSSEENGEESDAENTEKTALLQAFNQLTENIQVTEQQLEELADSRSQVVVDELLDDGVTESKLKLKPAYSSALSGTTLKFEVESQ